MNYSCELVDLNKMLIGPIGRMKPLCDSCCTRDCTNLIESILISEVGVFKKHRLYKTQAGVKAVIECKGYMPDGQSKQNKQSEDKA